MNPEITKRIEQYLQNELSAQDRAAFVHELNTNADLLREVALQQNIHEGAKRLAQRALVQRTAKRYHLQKTLVTTAIIVVIATAIAATVWLTTRSSAQPPQQEMLDVTEMAELIEKIEKELPLDGAPAEYFNLSPKDTVVLSESGVLLSVPGEAFMTDGQIYEGPKVIQWQEAFDAATIVKCGLSTMAGDKLLETQGMFGMQAFTPEGKQLDINPKVGVYIQIPVAEHKEGMMLFEGKKGKNGIIDWQNPKPLEKLPMMADMSELDFYPPGYEAHLDALQWKTGKKDRDSLYLSFEKEERAMLRDASFAAGSITGFGTNNPAVAAVVPRGESAGQNDNTSGLVDTIAFNPAGMAYSSDWTDKISLSCSVEKTGASHGVIVVKATLKPGWHIFSADHDPAKADGTGMPTQMIAGQDGKIRFDGTLRDGGKPEELVDDMGKSLYFSGTAVFRQPFTVFSGQPLRTSVQLSFQICDEAGCIFPTAQVFSLDMSGFEGEANGHIPPSKVLAFWQKDFNNTLLSTRDFERRMAAIHATCSEEVLDLYTDNLNKPLYEIDAMVAKLGHDRFNVFAEERVGAVKLDNPHMNNLRSFYAAAVARLRREAKKDRNFVSKQQAQWDAELRTVQRKASREDRKRNQAASAEEQRFNRESIARQFAANTVSVTIYRNAPANVYNCDRSAFAVASAPVVRTAQTADGTTQYTRETRKGISLTQTRVTTEQAVIRYNDFSLEVTDPKQYGKLMLYLFPHQLNSFVRIDPVNGKFTQRLNDEMMYDIVVVGISDDGYFLYEKRRLNKGELGEVELFKVSEETFTYRMKALNRERGDNPRPVTLDLDWLVKERRNYTEQRLRKENVEFRDQLRPKVFPCVGAADEVPMSDTVMVGVHNSDLPMISIDDQPQFPGGYNSMRSFLSDNLKYPKSAIEKGIEGKCNLRVWINEDGTVDEVVLLKGIPKCPECEEEAMRVVKLMPWIPGKQNGKAVKSYINLPVNFALK